MSKVRTLLYCIPLLYSSTLHAQTDRSALNGTVTDPSGAIIQGVVVKRRQAVRATMKYPHCWWASTSSNLRMRGSSLS